MIGYAKSDTAFENAARDPSERSTLLQKLRRRRNLALGGAIGALCAIVLGALIMLMIAGGMANGAGLRYANLFEVIVKIMRLLVPTTVGLTIGSVILNQDVKMLILTGATGASEYKQRAEQGEDAKPDSAPS